jgi:hypothetical protein
MSVSKEKNPVGDKFPVEWVEARDFERLSFERATWIPLVLEKDDILHGRFGTPGYRKAYRDIDSIIVPLDLKPEFDGVDWQLVSRHNSDQAWANDESFHPPGCYNGNPKILYPVIQRTYATGDPMRWDLLQELEVGMTLLRRGDVWIAPEEDDIEVAKLERDDQGRPDALLFRAEHLRDYLCAKKAALLLTGFAFRDAVEESFPELQWEPKTDDKRKHERHFGHGSWEGIHAPMHEGGKPFGLVSHVIHAWRESVDPDDDIPIMPHPPEEPEPRSESYTTVATGRKIFGLSGRIWVKHWILPAQKSPRIRRDEVEARVNFQVENQERSTMAGNALHDYRGWLWFKPTVIRRLLEARTSELKWYTAHTGEIGPAPHATLHFGVNRIGLINVLRYKMAQLPEWAQKYWGSSNVGPDGGLSEELHMSQNLARPAETMAPEAMLWNNLEILQGRTDLAYGRPLLHHFPSQDVFFHRIHRFYCDSFADVSELCKELHRIVSEPIDIGLLNEKIDPVNAKRANEKKLRQIKRLALWLDSAGLDGRNITRALAGVYELRIGDAHLSGSDIRDALELLHIPPDTNNYVAICYSIIGQVSNCVGRVADSVAPPSKIVTSG